MFSNANFKYIKQYHKKQNNKDTYQNFEQRSQIFNKATGIKDKE